MIYYTAVLVVALCQGRQAGVREHVPSVLLQSEAPGNTLRAQNAVDEG